MTRKKQNNNVAYMIIAAVILVASLFFANQQLALFGQEVYLPGFFRAECVERTESMSRFQVSTHTDDPTFYECTTKGTGRYVPITSGIACKYFPTDYTFIDAWDCPLSATISDKKGCDEILDDNFDFWRINAGRKILIDTDKLIGNARLFAEYPSFGIKAVSADNYGFPHTTSCELSSVKGKNYYTVEPQNRLEIPPGSPVNFMTKLSKGISTQVVTLPDVENGDPIYIINIGQYYKIKDQGEFLYVDTQETFKSDKIECIPRIACSDDAKSIDLTDQTCDMYGGSIGGYAPVPGDNTEICKWKCEDNKLKQTNDCIQVRQCPPEKPLWDAFTGECVIIVSPPTPPENNNMLLWILAGGAAIIAGAFLLTRRGQKKQMIF
jgi:hypothetical protein